MFEKVNYLKSTGKELHSFSQSRLMNNTRTLCMFMYIVQCRFWCMPMTRKHHLY
jgi:hypothetical protein